MIAVFNVAFASEKNASTCVVQLPSSVGAGGACTQNRGSAGPPPFPRLITAPTVSVKLGGLLSERIAMWDKFNGVSSNFSKESIPCQILGVHFSSLLWHVVILLTGQNAGA
jgi:hypothetical protein